MSEDKHTPGPWMRTELGTVIAGRTRYIVCEHASLEDARRIVACVNALERLSTEALERTVKAGGRSLVAEIEAEREAQAQRNANPQRPPTKRERFTDAIRTLLAKHGR